MSKAKKQHYVPQFLLRNFANGRKNKAKVWVLDKLQGKVFHSSVRDIAHENLFYEYDGEHGKYELEHLMEMVDTRGASILANITQNNKFSGTSEERVGLSYFIAAQLLRTPSVRNEMENFRSIIINKWGKDVHFNDDPKAVGDYGPEDSKANSLRTLKNVPDFAKMLQEKVWCLCQSHKSLPYVVSDNPVTRHNMIDYGPRGNLGLKNEGIEVYMPISTKLAVHIICPKIASAALLAPDLVDQYSYALMHGTPIVMKPENIEFFNSLQVIWAERFVYAKEREHLEMPLDMLRTNPELKYGPGTRMATN